MRSIIRLSRVTRRHTCALGARPVPSAVGYWRAVNRCTHEIREELPVRRYKVIAHKYVGGTEGKEVWLYEIVDGGHSWADKDLDVGEHIWSFFAKYLTTK